MTPVRVIQLVWSFEIGGAENFVLNLVRKMDRSRYEPSICVFAEDGPLRAQTEALGVPVFRIKPGSVPLTTLRLLRLLRAERPDLIHAHSIAPGFHAAAAGALCRIPVLTTRHGRPQESAKRSLRRAISIRFTDRFVAVSEEVRSLLISMTKIPEEKIFSVVNGIDTERFTGPRNLALRAELGIPDNVFLFGTVGRLSRVKAQDKMIRALKAVIDQNGDAYLVIAGDGPWREKLERLITELGLENHAHLLGARHDVPAILRALDAFVLSSVDEGTPLSLLEAMSAGLPCVATEVGGIPEVIIHEQNGLLAPPGDTDTLSAAMQRLLTDPDLRRRLAANGIETVRARFSLETMMQAYYRHYDALLQTGVREQGFTAELPCPGKLARRACAVIGLASDAAINRPILVLESDDWGRAATPSLETYQELVRRGAISAENPWSSDTLETPDDLAALREVLLPRPAADGRPLPITANFIVSNPDFAAISAEHLPFIPLDADEPNNPITRELRDAWKQAIADRILAPAYHGRWHLAPDALCRLWAEGEPAVTQCVERNTPPPGLSSGPATRLLSEYVRAIGTPPRLRPREAEEQIRIVNQGVAIFRAIFGHPPDSTAAPHYLWDRATEQAWHQAGIRAIQAANRHPDIRRRFGFFSARRTALGRRTPAGMVYLTRNCRFEPALYEDTAAAAFARVKKLFATQRPAVIGCHRINFTGSIFPARRQQTLAQLARLLDLVREKYPDVIFMTSGELGARLLTQPVGAPLGTLVSRFLHTAGLKGGR